MSARFIELAGSVGQVVEGRVVSVLDAGAFVDIGGAEGLLHVDDMSRTGERDPRALVWVGRVLQVRIISVDVARRRVSLSLRDPSEDPWLRALETYPVGTIRRALVTSHVAVPSGDCVFVQLEPGVDALVHPSDLPMATTAQDFPLGALVMVRVLSIDVDRHRVSAAIDS